MTTTYNRIALTYRCDPTIGDVYTMQELVAIYGPNRTALILVGQDDEFNCIRL